MGEPVPPAEQSPRAAGWAQASARYDEMKRNRVIVASNLINPKTSNDAAIEALRQDVRINPCFIYLFFFFYSLSIVRKSNNRNFFFFNLLV